MVSYHKDGTLPTIPQTIFVFGSNLAGRHGAGAAKVAHDVYGAKYGFASGLSGISYAIPTKDARLKTLDLHTIEFYIQDFIEFVEKHHYHDNFFITNVGCGLAGYKERQLAPIWYNAIVGGLGKEYFVTHSSISLSFPDQYERLFQELIGLSIIEKTYC